MEIGTNPVYGGTKSLVSTEDEKIAKQIEAEEKRKAEMISRVAATH